jgi:hypothetical protein
MLPTLSSNDVYATLMLAQASNAVRDEAGMPGWVVRTDEDDVLGTGQVDAPQAARDIALWVAYRAFVNPKNLSRRTAGPISETFRDGISGIALTDDEKTRLAALDGVGRTGGLWAQPIDAYSPPDTPILVPTVGPPWGRLWPEEQGFYLADSDQFPYNLEP